MSTLKNNEQRIEFPMNVHFETADELMDSSTEIMALVLTNVMCSKYYNEPLPKIGESLANLTVDNMEGAVQMFYNENTIDNHFEQVLGELIQKENYELCSLLTQWKEKLDSKLSK